MNGPSLVLRPRTTRQRIAALLVTLLVACVSLVPSNAGRRLGSMRAGGAGGDFPCASHECGCVDAESCRTNCCCFPKLDEPEEASCCSAEPAREPREGLPVIDVFRCRGGLGHVVAAPSLILVRRPELAFASPEPSPWTEPLPGLAPESRRPAPPSPPPRRGVV